MLQSVITNKARGIYVFRIIGLVQKHSSQSTCWLNLVIVIITTQYFHYPHGIIKSNMQLFICMYLCTYSVH